MIDYFIFGFSVAFISWPIGLVINLILLRTPFYDKISNFNFIKSKRGNKIIGVYVVKWIVTHTFFKFFNQKIKVDKKTTDLTVIRKEMTIAEIGHLIAFISLTFFAIYKSLAVHFLLGLIIMFFNVLMNLHPSLLQQNNKRRIDQLIKRQTKSTPDNLG